MSAFINKWKTLVGVSAVLLSIGMSTYAAPCTNASLIGSYGIQEQGMHTDSAGVFSEFRSIGTISFNGQGAGTKNETLWFRDFSINPVQSTVTYVVRSDCRFTFTYDINGESFEGVIVANGTRLLYMETGGDPVRNGQAEKIKTEQ